MANLKSGCHVALLCCISNSSISLCLLLSVLNIKVSDTIILLLLLFSCSYLCVLSEFKCSSMQHNLNVGM